MLFVNSKQLSNSHRKLKNIVGRNIIEEGVLVYIIILIMNVLSETVLLTKLYCGETASLAFALSKEIKMKRLPSIRRLFYI